MLGASNYTYAEATWTQTMPDWVASHVRAFEYFRGLTDLVIWKSRGHYYMADLGELGFEERLGLVVDREVTERRNRKLLTNLAKTDLLVLDERGLQPLDDHGRRDILEISEDRHKVRSILVTSQLPVQHWHEAVGDQTLADAILDRLVHNAYKINLKGESMRKKLKALTQTGH